MSTAYGNKIHSRWRAILSYSVTTTATQVTVTCKSGFQFINNANYDGSAARYSTIDGTKVQQSGSWSVSTNGTKYINTKTITYTRGTSAATKTIAFSSHIAGSYAPGTSSGSVSISVPALQSYTIQFNNNGGTGTIANKTKYYGQNLTLPSSGFTRSGFKFLGWSTSSTATTATYAPGAAYTSNTGAILYAVWEAVLIPHTVTNVNAERYRNGIQDDEGTSCHVSFAYTPATIAEIPQALSYEIYVYESGSTKPSTPIDRGTLNSVGGTFDKTVSGIYSINDVWEVDINVFVTSQTSIIVAKTSELPTAKFPFDALADGSAVGIMMPAQEGVDVSLPANTRVGGIPIGWPFPFDENGNLDVPGSITVGGHDSPVGKRLEGPIANTQVTSTITTKHTINLPEGIWIVTVNVCFGTKTTPSGSTPTAAGNRAVVLSTNDSASYTGAQVASSAYAPAGSSVRVQATLHAEAGSDGIAINVRLYSANNCATTLGHWFATRIA